MTWGIRDPRSAGVRYRGTAYRPTAEGLEARLVMAAINLANIDGLTGAGPYGVELAASQPGIGAGFSVADVNNIAGNSFDGMIVGAPTITTGTFGTGNISGPVLGTGTTSGANEVFLVNGSTATGPAISDWNNLTPVQRIGNLDSTLNSNPQTNPSPNYTAPNNVTYNYTGTIFTSDVANSLLGASVATYNNLPTGATGSIGFLIGAPGADRAYLVFGTTTLLGNKTVDLDAPPSGVNVITFTNTTQTGSMTGRSVTGLGNVFGDGAPAIAIGAPNASITGAGATGGAVYVIDGSAIANNRTTRTIDLSTIGQPNGTAGAIIAATNTGDQLGFSVGNPGSFDNATVNGQQIGDLLIGAPQKTSSSPGQAYLVYGGVGANSLQSLETVTNGVSYILASRIGATTTTVAPIITGVPGAIFNGAANLDQTGYAVAGAGDFNGDGFGDFMVGAPGATGGNGGVYLVYGKSLATRPNGVFTLGTLPTSISSATFTGSGGELAGYSLSLAGRSPASLSTTNAVNPIEIGAPGNNGGAGAIYDIPGNIGLFGTTALTSVNTTALGGNIIQLTTSTNQSFGQAFLGTGVSGRIVTGSQSATLDADKLGDVVAGAAGLGFTSSRTGAGGVFGLERSKIPLGTPVVTGLNPTIGVGSLTAPFSIDATTPAALNIFVFSIKASGTTPAFMPVTEIDPTTITVNGVAFPTATITSVPDANGDGIPEAQITITPRSNLNLVAGTVTFTVQGRTLSTSALPNMVFTGTASVTVTTTGTSGGGSSGGGGTITAPPAGLTNFGNSPTTFVSDTGGSFVPTTQTLSKLNGYKPIPQVLAYQQFLEPLGFRQRTFAALHPNAHVPDHFVHSWHNSSPSGVYTLGRKVFDRSRFHQGKTYVYTHRVKVIPTYSQTQKFIDPKHASGQK